MTPIIIVGRVVENVYLEKSLYSLIVCCYVTQGKYVN